MSVNEKYVGVSGAADTESASLMPIFLSDFNLILIFYAFSFNFAVVRWDHQKYRGMKMQEGRL